MEIEVIGATLQGTNKMINFKTNQHFKIDDEILVNSEDGLAVAKVVKTNYKIQVEDASQVFSVERKLTQEDREIIKKHILQSAELKEQTKHFIRELGLQMKLIDVSISFDEQKAYFIYVSDDRVDFRELVKVMASNFKMRIELKQVGVRDEARVIGGLGPCGRVCCCKGHLADFENVSVKMAKTQNLSLNPQKISGLCGRLMCCLAYENEQYREMTKDMPKINAKVNNEKGKGVVSFIDVFKQTITVKFVNETSTEYCEYTTEEFKKEFGKNMPQQSVEESTLDSENEDLPLDEVGSEETENE